MDFFYDASGELLGFKDNGTKYYYRKNLQGDIVGILNASGEQVVSYTYDAWGRQVTSTGDGSLAAKNPFRYRGYYYDVESGWYYLGSRYYDPEVGRFISADTTDILDVSGNLYDKNLYAYCDNNPVVRKDITGEFWLEAGIVAAGAVIGGLMGAMSAASTGGNIKEAIIEGALTGAAGSAMGLSKYNPLIAGMMGAGIDIGVQLVSQYSKNKQINFKNIDYGRALKTGIQTSIGVAIPAFENVANPLTDAIGTAVAWTETTVLIVASDIIVTNMRSETSVKRSVGRLKGISHYL